MAYQHIVSVSGGKDSDCIYLLAIERGMPFRAIFADTGNEHPWTYEHVERLADRTGGPKIEWIKRDFAPDIARRRQRLPLQWQEAGVPQTLIDEALALMEPTGIPYLDMVLAKGMFATTKGKFCTEVLKEEPSDQYVVRPLIDAGVNVVRWLGIRSDESEKRSEYPMIVYGKPYAFSEKRGRIVDWRPIFLWSVEDVVAFHKKHGLPMNPLYGLGFKRVGCFPCINEGKDGLAIIARRFPEHVARIREWERICLAVAVARKHAHFSETATFFPTGTVPGIANASIDDVMTWATTKRGGRQQDMFRGLVPDLNHFACTGGMGWCEAA